MIFSRIAVTETCANFSTQHAGSAVAFFGRASARVVVPNALHPGQDFSVLISACMVQVSSFRLTNSERRELEACQSSGFKQLVSCLTMSASRGEQGDACSMRKATFLCCKFLMLMPGGSSQRRTCLLMPCAEAVKAAFDYFSQRGASSMVVPEWVPTPVNVQFNAAIVSLNRLVYGMISQRRMQLQQQPQPPAVWGPLKSSIPTH